MGDCVHSPWPGGYIHGSLLAEQMMADGWKQKKCPGCGLWKQWWRGGSMLAEIPRLRDEDEPPVGGQCESWFEADVDGLTYRISRCDREVGHRPQDWHRATHPDGGTVDWSFTDEERAKWKQTYGVASKR